MYPDVFRKRIIFVWGLGNMERLVGQKGKTSLKNFLPFDPPGAVHRINILSRGIPALTV